MMGGGREEKGRPQEYGVEGGWELGGLASLQSLLKLVNSGGQGVSSGTHLFIPGKCPSTYPLTEYRRSRYSRLCWEYGTSGDFSA